MGKKTNEIKEAILNTIDQALFCLLTVVIPFLLIILLAMVAEKCCH